MVVAVAQNGVIGRGNGLPWKLGSDLQRFKRITMGHCLLMGRRTFESIGRLLPGRQTIVLSRRGLPIEVPGLCSAGELSEVEQLVEPGRKIMVVGGSEVFRLSMPWCKQIWLTRVLADVDGDVFFPELDWSGWRLLEQSEFPAGPKDDWPTRLEYWSYSHSHT